MLKSLKKKMKDQAGLTLIELLVVIVILGIIAAVAIPMVMSNRADAARSTNAQNLTVLQDAVNRHLTVTGNLPETLADLAGDYIEAVPTPETFNGCEATAFGYADGNVSLTGTCLPQ